MKNADVPIIGTWLSIGISFTIVNFTYSYLVLKVFKQIILT